MPAVAPLSLGLKPSKIGHILGIVKAYTTRVGEGPFPSEIKNNLGLKIAKIGREFGSVTGRPRRCGWFDAVQCKKAINISGIDSLALTKIDVLDNLKKIKICNKYKLKNKILDQMPTSNNDLKRVKPQYLTLDGWNEDTSKIKKLKFLPLKARRFISTIEKLLGVPITFLSNGPDRSNIIKLKKFF